jgi:hypothetical protein
MQGDLSIWSQRDLESASANAVWRLTTGHDAAHPTQTDDTLVLRVKPDNVKIQVTRSSVSSLVTGEVKK